MGRRILALNERDTENPLAGGAEVHVFEIFRRLAERGHDVTLLAASYPGCERETTIDGVRVRRLTNRYLYYGLAPWIARREGGDYDVVVDVLNKLPFLSRWTTGRPTFAIVHHLFGTTAFRQVSFPIALATYLSEKLIPSAYRGVPMLAISPSTREDLGERGVDRAQVSVVPPGVDHAHYRPVDDGRGREPIVLWIGRLEPYKRGDVAIDAFASLLDRVADARLVFVGAGGHRETLEAHARARGVAERVTFTGFISEQAKIDWLQRAAVLVQTSEKEGWGMTVIEAAACNTPSVASAVEGLRDAVVDGTSGLLVPYGEAGPLADAMAGILTDGALRDRLIEGGREWAARFSWDRVADDTEALIELAIDPTRDAPVLTATPFPS